MQPISHSLPAIPRRLLHRGVGKSRVGLVFSRSRKSQLPPWGKPLSTWREFDRPDILEGVLATDDESTQTYRVDDQTWQDLSMDQVFNTLNHTLSIAGCQQLFYRLRRPFLAAEPLGEFEALVHALTQDPSGRDWLRSQFLRVPRSDWHAPHLLWRLPRDIPFPSWALFLLPFVLVVSVVAALVASPFAWALVGISFVSIVAVHVRIQREIGTHMASLSHLRHLIAMARRIARRSTVLPDDVREDLGALAQETWKFVRRTWFINFRDPFALSEYARLILLSEARAYASCLGLLRRRQRSLQKLYLLLGRLDAAQAIGSLRANGSAFTRPRIGGNEKQIRVKDLRHPLLTDPVGNDVSLDRKGLLITGLNMSGKTTFLRALGVNSILAQGFHTVFAGAMELPFLRVRTSINTHDDLLRGKSYYQSEVESILSLVLASSDTFPRHLFLLDELFRGTNSIERVAAGASVLKYLVRNHFVVAATHDMEVCTLVGDDYVNLHFSDKVGSGGIFFDYCVRLGPCPATNAIPLLRFAGFPPDIIRQAESFVTATGPA